MKSRKVGGDDGAVLGRDVMVLVIPMVTWQAVKVAADKEGVEPATWVSAKLAEAALEEQA